MSYASQPLLLVFPALHPIPPYPYNVMYRYAVLSAYTVVTIHTSYVCMHTHIHTQSFLEESVNVCMH